MHVWRLEIDSGSLPVPLYLVFLGRGLSLNLFWLDWLSSKLLGILLTLSPLQHWTRGHRTPTLIFLHGCWESEFRSLYRKHFTPSHLPSAQNVLSLIFMFWLPERVKFNFTSVTLINKSFFLFFYFIAVARAGL